MLFKINIIDDEKNLNDLVRTYLEKEGYSVCSFYTYDEALLHKDDDVHLWLIDIMLDKASGFELFNEIKASKPKMPIIFMSARDQEFDRIIGLEKGSDDYITKPFNPLELIARVKSAYRRYTKYNEKNEENIIYINGLEIDQDKHICKLYDKQVELTPMEFDILLYLTQKRGNVVSSEELFEKVWKEKYLENNNTVMVHIRRIREKLNEDTKKPKFIKTVWGVGYKIEK